MAGRAPTPAVDDGHATLFSELGSDDLTFAVGVDEPTGADPYAFDLDADPDGTFPQSVAGRGPTPSGVILRTRAAPDVFGPEVPLAVRVATDDGFHDLADECWAASPVAADAGRLTPAASSP